MESNVQHLHGIDGDFERTVRDCKQLIAAARRSMDKTQKIIDGTKATLESSPKVRL
jgi:hypothetical protein